MSDSKSHPVRRKSTATATFTKLDFDIVSRNDGRMIARIFRAVIESKVFHEADGDRVIPIIRLDGWRYREGKIRRNAASETFCGYAFLIEDELNELAESTGDPEIIAACSNAIAELKELLH